MPATFSTHPVTRGDDSDQRSIADTRPSRPHVTYDLTSSGSASSSDSHSDEWLKPPAAPGITDSNRTTTSVSSSEDGRSCCSVWLLCVGRWLVGSLAEDITRSEAWLLATIVTVNFLSFCAGSILAPILPQHLSDKMEQFGEEGSVSELYVSLPFVLYAGTSMCFSPVFGPLIPRFGVEYLYYPGLVTVALTNIALGAIDLLPIGSYDDYILAQCIIRVLEGAGAAAFNTSSHSIIMRVFSRHIDEAFAAVEAAVAISFSLGPVIGSFLVTSFGWFWAFLVFGAVVLATIPVSVYVFAKYGSLRYVNMSSGGNALLPLRLILSWKGIFVVITMIVTTTAYSFVEPTLELFLENVLRTETSTLYYFAEAAAFALTALAVAPFIAARSKMGTMILGTAILGVSFLLVGPCRFIFRDPNSHSTMSGVILLGVGFALAYVPTLDFLVDTAIYDFGYLKGPATYGPISGLWNFLNGFGETFGPVIAMFQKSSDIRDSTVVFATVLFACAMLLMLIFFHLSIEKMLGGDRLDQEEKEAKFGVLAGDRLARRDESKFNNNNNNIKGDKYDEPYNRSSELTETILDFFISGTKHGKNRRESRPAKYEQI